MSSLSLPISVATPNDAEQVREFVAAIIAARRSKQADPTGLVSAETEAWVLSLCGSNIGDAEVAQKAILLQLELSPTIELSTAAPVSDDLRRQIIGWLRREIHPAVIVRERSERSLLGGVKVRTGRAVYNLSVAAALDNSVDKLTEMVHGWA